MIITRKIEIFIPEKDGKMKKAYYDQLFALRKVAVKVANMTASHLFALDNTMPYLSKEDREAITFLGVKGDKATRQNAAYVAASEAFKGKASTEVIANVIQNVKKSYSADKKNGGSWEKSLRSHKATLPIPFKADSYRHLRFEEYVNGDGETREGCFFTLMGIPFQMAFRKDRSGNRTVVRRILDQMRFTETAGQEGAATGYKMCMSSISIRKETDEKTGKKNQKIYLFLCVDIPMKKAELRKDRVLYAYLGVSNPIVYAYDAEGSDIWNSGIVWGKIGNHREYTHRRKRISEAVRRCQIDSRYTKGGHGRKRKMEAIGRYEEMEKNYVDTKLHQYSRMLIDIAVANQCGTIRLIAQKEREKKAKFDNETGKPTLLRNWSYYNLKTKIEYKAAQYGIEVPDIGNDEDEDGGDKK